MAVQTKDSCKEDLKFEMQLKNPTSEPKNVTLFKKNVSLDSPKVYLFTTPYAVSYNNGTQFRFKANGNNYNFTISSNTAREDIVPLLNNFNVGLWELDPGISNNIFKASTLTDIFQELEINFPLPDAAGNITGVTTVCQGQSGVAYSVPAINNATGYVWNLPSGATIVSGNNTNSIVVNYSLSAVAGNISVYGTNVFGNGSPSPNLAITVNSIPANPGVITGNNNVSQGQSGVAYSVAAVSGATSYLWTVPTGATIASGAGTNSITVDYGPSAVSGNVTVVGVNGCGNSSVPSTLAITVSAIAGWVSRTSAVDSDWVSVAWSPSLGLFVAVAFSGSDRVMTSPDGINWTSRTTPLNQWVSVCWSPELSLFVAMGAGTPDQAMTSPDGINWTIRSVPDGNNWTSVTWSPSLSLFVAVAGAGTGDRVMTSPDGINWTSRTSAADNYWTSVTWSPELSLFVAVAGSGTGNRVMTSPDGINWISRTSAADNDWQSVVWSASLSLFVAVSSTGTGNRVMTSPDGINWTLSASAADNDWYEIVWSASLSLFVAVSSTGTGNRVMTSPDGINWTLRTSAADNQWQSVVWSPQLGLFVAVSISGTGNRVMTSQTGT